MGQFIWHIGDMEVKMKLNEIIDIDKKYYMNTFGNRTPVCFEYGKGINLFSTDGKKYYDFLAGIAVNVLGHSHPAIVNAVKEQAEKLIHCSSLYYIEPQAKLAKMLVENSCADRVFFANSGAEANEGAIKLAKIYFYKKGMHEKCEIITLKNSFHGRTITTVTATGQEKYQKPYMPLTPGFKHVAINDLKDLYNTVNNNTCAIMLELIQGESGVNPVSAEYLKGVRKLCDEKGILLIFDEIQTGLGRTGKLFAYQHYGVEPDILTLAKALGGGMPIGAICAKEHVASAFEPGDHGSTFGGNPLVCAVGLSVLSFILQDDLSEKACEMGEYLMDALSTLSKKHTIISGIRGKGLMVGVQLSEDKAVAIKNKCFEKGYLIGNVGNSVLRLLPPLIVSREDIDGMVNTLDEVLEELKEIC